MLMKSIPELIYDQRPDFKWYLNLNLTPLSFSLSVEQIQEEYDLFLKRRWRQYTRKVREDGVIGISKFRSREHLRQWMEKSPDFFQLIQSYMYTLSQSAKDRKRFTPVIHRIDKKGSWTIQNLRLGVQHMSQNEKRHTTKVRDKAERIQAFVFPTDPVTNKAIHSERRFFTSLSKLQKALKIPHKSYIRDCFKACEKACPEISTRFTLYTNAESKITYLIIEEPLQRHSILPTE